MFEIRQAAGKGLGIFAAQPILRGQRVLVDKPLLSVSANDAGSGLLRQAHALSDAGKTTLLELSINPARSTVLSWIESVWRSRTSPTLFKTNHTILNVFRNNNFTIGNDIRALFPQVARLNHACVPNSQGNFNRVLNAFTIHATRNIRKEEEITISYLEDQVAQRHSRQATLLQGYGFTCTCAACDKRVIDGESRRTEIKKLLESFAENTEPSPEEELGIMLDLLKFYEEEGIRGREVATMSIAAANKALELDRKAQAQDLAAKGLHLEEESVGIDSPFYQEARDKLDELGIRI